MPGPLLARVTVCGGLLVASARVAKASVDGVSVALGGVAKPLTTTTRLLPPNVEKRKDPETGSMAAPSAPDSPPRNRRRLSMTGLPFASMS